MELKYIGLKSYINQHGIFFKTGKEDKFSYLSSTINILKAIDNNYERQKHYTYECKQTLFESANMIEILKSYFPNIEEDIEKKINKFVSHLEREDKEIRNSTRLNDLEKVAFCNNLNLMKNYKKGRMQNKIFYFYCIDAISKVIIKNKIKRIDTIFNEKFWHVLDSVKHQLAKYKINSTLKTQIKEDNIKAIFSISI